MSGSKARVVTTSVTSSLSSPTAPEAIFRASLDAKAVRKMIQDITAGKTAVDEKTTVRGRAIVTGGAGTASRVADLLSGIVAWTVDDEYLDSNPVHGVRRYRGSQQAHIRICGL